jgi:hypothetical protein
MHGRVSYSFKESQTPQLIWLLAKQKNPSTLFKLSVNSYLYFEIVIKFSTLRRNFISSACKRFIKLPSAWLNELCTRSRASSMSLLFLKWQAMLLPGLIDYLASVRTAPVINRSIRLNTLVLPIVNKLAIVGKDQLSAFPKLSIDFSHLCKLV